MFCNSVFIVYIIKNLRYKMERNCVFDRQAFCRKLRNLRQYYGLSQQDLADCLRIDRSTYASYEIGRSMPSLESIKRIAEFLHVSSDFLLDIHSEQDQAVEDKMNRILKRFPNL